ncbi:MAG: sialidase family protein, partial [Bryobacteraceae bacterium]
MTRRYWMSLAAASQVGAATKGELYALTVCPWTARNPRHDHAQILPLSGGRLLLVWSEYYVRKPSTIIRTPYSKGGTGDEAPCQLSGKISLDGGRSWSETLTMQENIAADCVKHPNLLRLPSGEILMLFTVRNFKTNESRVFLRRSKDECESWSKPEQITPDGGFWLINCDHIIRHSSGRVVLPMYFSPSIWDAKEHFTAFCMYSDDEGRTWKQSRNRMNLSKRGAEEPGMVELKDGSLYTILRTSLGRIYSATS